nr:MAG TPA: hypothetical protein [Caudoviricetes sp.]
MYLIFSRIFHSLLGVAIRLLKIRVVRIASSSRIVKLFFIDFTFISFLGFLHKEKPVDVSSQRVI